MKYFFIALFTCFTYTLFAQLKSVKRAEIELDNRFDKTTFYTFKSKVLMQRYEDDEKQKIDKDNDIITYNRYDKNLAQTGSVDVKILESYRARTNFKTKSSVFEFGYSYRKGKYVIHKIDVATMDVKTVEDILPKKTSIGDVNAINENVYLIGRVKKNPVVIIKNLASGSQTVTMITPLQKKKFQILDFETDPKTKEAYLITRDFMGKKSILKIYVFAENKIIKEIVINNDIEDKYIIDGTISKLETGGYIITGTYSNERLASIKFSDKGSITRTNEADHRSVGVYIVKVMNDKEEFKTFINYLDIKNFTSYLPEKAQKKIEKRKNKKASKGDELEYDYLMSSHNIIENNGEFILVGEALYPTYRLETTTTTTADGKTVTRTEQIFDGFQYTHFFALSFNEKGTMLWSNSSPFEINNKPYIIKQFLTLKYENNILNAVYSDSGKFHAVAFDKSNKPKPLSYDLSNTLDENDKIKWSYDIGTEHWYGSYYISYGSQRIKNKNKEDKRRSVFYLNKIEFKP